MASRSGKCVLAVLFSVAHCTKYGAQFLNPWKRIPMPTTCVVETNRTTGMGLPVLCRPAQFGDQTTFETAGQRTNKAMLDRSRAVVVADPIDACQRDELCANKSCEGMIVLAMRGTCPFYEKALNVMYSSDGMAAALLIVDSQPSPNGLPITMTRGDAPIHDTERWASIPVVAILKQDGDALVNFMKDTGEASKLGIQFTEGGWQHVENEYTIRQQLLSKSSQDDYTLWHNLGAAIGSSSQDRNQEAIDAVEAAVAIKPTMESLDILQDLYYREAMYLGMAFTSCRQASLSQDPEEVEAKKEKGFEDYLMTLKGVKKLREHHVHFCDQVEQYQQFLATSGLTRTIYEYIEVSSGPIL